MDSRICLKVRLIFMEQFLPYTDVETLNEVLGDACKLLERVLTEERGLGVQKQKK